jgi:hypothetical protein
VTHRIVARHGCHESKGGAGTGVPEARRAVTRIALRRQATLVGAGAAAARAQGAMGSVRRMRRMRRRRSRPARCASRPQTETALAGAAPGSHIPDARPARGAGRTAAPR